MLLYYLFSTFFHGLLSASVFILPMGRLLVLRCIIKAVECTPVEWRGPLESDDIHFLGN